MDRIFVTALATEAVIGIYDWEREVRQKLEVDLEMWMDLSAAGRSDAIEDTLNYKSVAKRVLAFVEASSFRLDRFRSAPAPYDSSRLNRRPRGTTSSATDRRAGRRRGPDRGRARRRGRPGPRSRGGG